MLISELLAELERLKAVHGDIPVILPVNGYDNEDPGECGGAAYHPAETKDRRSWSVPWAGVYVSPPCIHLLLDIDWKEGHPLWTKTP